MFGFGVASELWKDSKLRGLMGDLVTKTLKADVQILQNGAELSYRLVQCGLPSGFKRGQAGEDGTAEAVAIIKGMIQLNVNYYATLVDLNLKFTHGLLDTVKGQPAPSPVGKATRDLQTMSLVASVGDRLRAPFRVENNRAEPTRVTFRLTPFERDDGIQIVASGVTFAPSEIELQAHQEAQISLLLPVNQEFEAGHVYLATLSVEGMDAMRLRVRLQVQ